MKATVACSVGPRPLIWIKNGRWRASHRGGPGYGSYSARMAMTGSIRVARRAGTSPAIAATTMRTTRLAR